MKFGCIGIAGALAVLALGAAEAATVKPAGPTNFAVPPEKCGDVQIVVQAVSDQPLPTAIRTLAIDPLPKPESAWTITWQAPEAVRGGLANEWKAIGRIGPQAGAAAACPQKDTPFVVMLGVLFGTSGTDEQTLPIVVNGGTGSLDAPDKWTVPKYLLPFGWFWPSEDLKVEIPIRESSHTGALPSISVASPTAVTTANGRPTRVTIAAPGPLSLPAGGAGKVALTLGGSPDPAAMTAKVALFGRGIPKEKVVDLTIDARVHWLFLLLTIIVGVFFGWLINEYLQPLGALDEGKKEGLRAAADIARRAEAQRDPQVQQQLIGISQALATDVTAAKKVEAVTQAVNARNEEAKKVETEAVALATTVRSALDQIRGVIRPGGGLTDPAIAKLLARTRAAFDQIVAIADAGRIIDAKTALDAFRGSLPEEVASVLRPWLVSLHDALTAFGKWSVPAGVQEPEKTRGDLITEVVTAAKQTDATELTKQSDAVARKLGWWLTFSARQAPAENFHAAAAVLRSSDVVMADEFERLAAAVARRTGGDDVLHDVEELAKARNEAVRLLLKKAPANATVTAALDAGDFATAAREAIAPSQAAPSFAPTPLATATGGMPPLPDMAQLTSVRVNVGVVLPIGAAANAGLVSTAPAGGIPTVTGWTVTPTDATDPATGPGGNTFGFTPIKHGWITISASWAAGEAKALAFAGDITGTRAFSALAIESYWIGRAIDLTTAVFTVFAGYLTFADTWYGTGPNFFAALSWGFFGQFGLGRIKALTTTIVNKAVPA